MSSTNILGTLSFTKFIFPLLLYSFSANFFSIVFVVRFSLANRLVGGLASENVRWAESVEEFREAAKTLPGDVLLTTAFISYVGCFIKSYRMDLMENQWLPYLHKLSVGLPSFTGVQL